MALDENRVSRDYLYGRLLAWAEYIEASTLEMLGENRRTNAEKLVARFVVKPCETWSIIYRKLQIAYIPRLQYLQNSKGMKGLLLYRWAKGVLESIMDRFSPEDFSSNERLGDEYLIGYHNQYSWFKKSKEQRGEGMPAGSDSVQQ